MDKFSSKPRISELFVGKSASQIYKLLDITEADDENVRILDEATTTNGVLMLYSHLLPTPTVSHVKGIIVRHTAFSDPVIVCQSYPHTIELDISEAAQLPNRGYLTIDKDTEVTCAWEGTILRVFCVDKEWYISTHKKIDGTSSRWAGPTFGELFYDIWGKEDLKTHLIDGYCYVFLLRHPKNRIVCSSTNEILLVAVYEPDYNGRLRKMDRREMNFAIPTDTKHPYTVQPLVNVSTFEQLFELASRVDPSVTTGTLIYKKATESGKLDSFVKIVAPGYDKLRLIRGNEPRIGISYLTLLRANNTEGAKILRTQFPEEKELFSRIDSAYSTLETRLLSMYTTRYINHQYLRLPGPENFVVHKTHSLVVERNITPVLAIKDVLATSTPAQLYALIGIAS